MKMKFYVFLFLIFVLFALMFFRLKFPSENEDANTGNNVISNSGENIENSDANVSIEYLEDGTAVEIKSINTVKTVGNIEFSNMKIGKINNSKCVFTADIKNLSDDFLKAERVSVKLIDADGEVKDSFGGVLPYLVGGETKEFKTYALADITYASDIEFVIVQNE